MPLPTIVTITHEHKTLYIINCSTCFGGEQNKLQPNDRSDKIKAQKNTVVSKIRRMQFPEVLNPAFMQKCTRNQIDTGIEVIIA